MFQSFLSGVRRHFFSEFWPFFMKNVMFSDFYVFLPILGDGDGDDGRIFLADPTSINPRRDNIFP